MKILSAEIAEAIRIATICRETFEELWDGWRRVGGYKPIVFCVSQDACGASSFALHDVLKRLGSPLPWRVVGGRIKVLGRWRDHAWVEAHAGRRRLIADITADQFGLPPVIVSMDYGAIYRKTMDEADLPPWRERDGIHISMWSGLVIYCEENALRHERMDASR